MSAHTRGFLRRKEFNTKGVLRLTLRPGEFDPVTLLSLADSRCSSAIDRQYGDDGQAYGLEQRVQQQRAHTPHTRLAAKRTPYNNA